MPSSSTSTTTTHMFPQIYGGNMWIVVVDVLLLGIYLGLALMAARQQPG